MDFAAELKRQRDFLSCDCCGREKMWNGSDWVHTHNGSTLCNEEDVENFERALRERKGESK